MMALLTTLWIFTAAVAIWYFYEDDGPGPSAGADDPAAWITASTVIVCSS